MPGQPLAITIVAAATLLVIITFTWVIASRVIRYRNERRAALILRAAENNLQLANDKPPPSTFEPKPKEAAQLSMKQSRYRSLFLGTLGKTGPPTRIFQHNYTVSTGQSTFTISHRVAEICIPKDWPITRICSKKKGKLRFGKWKKRKPLTVESTELNQRYLIKSTDPGFALILADPPLQAALLTIPKTVALALHIENGKLYYLEKGTINIDTIDNLINRLLHILNALNPELWLNNQKPQNFNAQPQTTPPTPSPLST